MAPRPARGGRSAFATVAGLALGLVSGLASCGPFGPPAPTENRPGVATDAGPGSGTHPGPVPAMLPQQTSSGGRWSAGGVGPTAGGGSSRDLTLLDPVDLAEQQSAEAAARAGASVVALEYSPTEGPPSTRRAAAGVVIDDAGHVLSVRIDRPPAGAGPILARAATGRALTAAWVAADAATGLTLLRIPTGHAAPAVPARREVRPGHSVFVVGNPFGLGPSVSRGLVAGLNRRLDLGPRALGGLIQLDVSLHLGDSGALVADPRGAWLGLIRSTVATPVDGTTPAANANANARGFDHDLGFAIAAVDALWVAEQLRLHRRVERAYLGLIADPTLPPPGPTPGTDPTAPAPPILEGLTVRQVLPDTPADRAGLKPGDRLLALDGHPVRTPFDLSDRLDRTAAGASVVVEVERPTTPGQPSVRLNLPLHTTRHPPIDPPRPSRRPKTPADSRDKPPTPSDPLGRKTAPPDATAIARER